MEQNEQNLINKKETLSQSHLHNIERMRRKIGGIVTFELPKEKLIEREHAWDKLFEKYSEIIPNDVDINIQDSNWESKNNESDNGGNNDDENENRYFSKCRTPMRKHPALVQYWVDTGNPPYQLVDEFSSGTGSSLSEAENSKSLLIDNQRTNIKYNRDNSTSLYSSVDTVAYILSNANVTKKSDTIAIVEGSKNSNVLSECRINSIAENGLSKNSSKDGIVTNKALDNCDSNNKNLKNNSDMNKIIGLTTQDKSSSLLNETIINKNEKTEKNSPVERIMDHRMKIADILPTLAHLDKLLNSNNIEDQPHDNILSDENTLFEKTPNVKSKKLFNRKKLYTERNSPIDLIVSLSNKKRVSINSSLHPALSTPIPKATTLFARRRTRRFQRMSKKRFSRLSNISKNSSTKVNNIKNTKNTQNIETTVNSGNEDVLKSLELTPSNENARQRFNRIPQLNGKSTKKITRKKQRSSLISDDSDVSYNVTESPACGNDESQREKKLTDLVALCSLKNLEIWLERYEETKSSSTNSLNDKSTHQMLTESSASSKKNSDDVHEVDLDSQESNQSTILICKCTNNREINTTLKTKIPNESQQNIDGKVEKMDTTTICSALLIESDENSSTESPPKLQTCIANSTIEFSSDDDDDFIKIIRKNQEKCQKKSYIDMAKCDKSVSSTATDCKDLIKDLTDQFNEESKIPIEFPTAPNLTIVESDNEYSINPQELTIKTKKENHKHKIAKIVNKSSTRTRQTLQSSSVTNMIQNSREIKVARVLRYQSFSDSSASNENIVTPPKRLKLDDNMTSNVLLNNSIETSRRKYSREYSNNDSSVHVTIRLPNENVAQSTKRKRKMMVHFFNETNELTTKTIPPTWPLFMRGSNTVSKNISTPLEKCKSPLLLTPSSQSSTSEKNNWETKTINSSNNISINKSEKAKRYRQNSSILNRTTAKNKSLPRTNHTVRSGKKVDRLLWNESSSDDDELIVGSRNETKISSLNKSYDNSVHKMSRQITISNLLDDSSSDGSLKITSFARNQRVNSHSESTKKTMTFRTRFDDSDSEQ